MTRVKLLILALGVLFIFPTAAWPTVDTWESPPEIIATGTNLNAPQIVADPSGNSHAVWYSLSGSNPDYTIHIYYSYRAAGGNWLTPVDVSGSIAGTAPKISIVIDLASPPNAYIAWLYDDHSNSDKSTLRATSIASPYTAAATASTLDNSGHATSFCLNYNTQIVLSSPQVGVPGAIIVYEYYDSGTPLYAVNYSTSDGGAWATAAHIVFSAAHSYYNPQVATAPAGSGGMGVYYANAYAFWIQGSGSSFDAY